MALQTVAFIVYLDTDETDPTRLVEIAHDNIDTAQVLVTLTPDGTRGDAHPSEPVRRG